MRLMEKTLHFARYFDANRMNIESKTLRAFRTFRVVRLDVVGCYDFNYIKIYVFSRVGTSVLYSGLCNRSATYGRFISSDVQIQY